MPSCREYSQNSIIPAPPENQRSFRVENNNQKCICLVTVDGCAITQGVRCDYLYEIYELPKDGQRSQMCPPNSKSHPVKIEKVIYLELKGTDVVHAFEQLEATIRFYCQQHKDCKEKEAYIIPSNVRPALTTKIQQAKTKFLRELKTKLTVKNRSHSVSV